MQTDLVSIITPLYNGEKYIAHTIDSVLAQTYVNWEMLIINDGSKDGSEAIVKAYADRDPRIKLYSQPNGGSASARNNGVRRAKGQYFAFLDADDLWEPFFLEAQLEFMRQKGATLVYGSHKRIDENGRECLRPFIVPERVTYRDLLKTCSISFLTVLYDASRLGKLFFNEELNSLRDDYLFLLAILKKTGVAHGNRRVVASYRILWNSVSRNKKKMIAPQFKIYYKYEKLGLLPSLYYLAHWAFNGFLKYRK